jgi:hypothetical protein
VIYFIYAEVNRVDHRPDGRVCFGAGRHKDIKFRNSVYRFSARRAGGTSGVKSMTTDQLMHGVYAAYGLGLKAVPALVLPDPIPSSH